MAEQPRAAKLTLTIAGLLAFLTIACHADVIYSFTNFDGPGSGSAAAAGTNMNGIANSGAAVGFGLGNSGKFTNFVRNANGTLTTLNINGSTAAMPFGINSASDVVGTDGNGNAFSLPKGGPVGTLATPGTPSTAFGINDKGYILAQSLSGGIISGFFLANSSGLNVAPINAPAGPDIVNAQGSTTTT